MSTHYTNFIETDQNNGSPMNNGTDQLQLHYSGTPMDGIWDPDISGGGGEQSGGESMDTGGDAYRYWDHISVHNESTNDIDGMDVWPTSVQVPIPVVQCELLEAVPNNVDPDMPPLESISDSGSNQLDESTMSTPNIALIEEGQPRVGAYGFAATIARHQSRQGMSANTTTQSEVPPPPPSTNPPPSTTLLGTY